MFSIYLVQLPWNYTKRVWAFSSKETAQKFCDAIDSEKLYTATGKKPIEYQELEVHENDDIKFGDL